MELVYKRVKIGRDRLSIILGDGGILRQLAENRLIFKLSARQLTKSVRQSRNLRNGNGRILFDSVYPKNSYAHSRSFDN